MSIYLNINGKTTTHIVLRRSPNMFAFGVYRIREDRNPRSRELNRGATIYVVLWWEIIVETEEQK